MAMLHEVPGSPEDAPDVYGDAYIQAIKERDAVGMNTIIRLGFLMGNYTKRLTKEEQDWVFKNLEQL